MFKIVKKYVNKVFEVNDKLNYFDFIHSSRATTLSKIYLSQYNIIPNPHISTGFGLYLFPLKTSGAE